jgi:hypothetical protein
MSNPKWMQSRKSGEFEGGKMWKNVGEMEEI